MECAAASAASAAVSARKIRGPKLAGIHPPDSIADSSSAVNPDSGPHKKTTSVFPVPTPTPSSADSSEPPARGDSKIRRESGNGRDRNSRRLVNPPTVGTRARPHCSQAAIASRRARSAENFAAAVFAVSSGTISSAPNSVIFSTAQSILPGAHKPCPTRIRIPASAGGGGRRETIRAVPASAPSETISAMNSLPFPSNKITASPARIRKTRNKRRDRSGVNLPSHPTHSSRPSGPSGPSGKCRRGIIRSHPSPDSSWPRAPDSIPAGASPNRNAPSGSETQTRRRAVPQSPRFPKAPPP